MAVQSINGIEPAYKIPNLTDLTKAKNSGVTGRKKKGHLVNSVEPQTSTNIFLTTKRLLTFASKNDLIATDTTYKLNWQGHPLILVGTVDKERHFHPFGVLLTKKRKSGKFSIHV